MDNYHPIHTPKGQLGSRNIHCSNEVNYAADYLKYQKCNPFNAKRANDPTAKKKE